MKVYIGASVTKVLSTLQRLRLELKISYIHFCLISI